MSGAEFQDLSVLDVERLTDDAVAIEFAVPTEFAEDFRFVAGQHVIVRRQINGQDVRRSYSLCVPVNSGRLRVAVKQVRGGMFSTFANTVLRAGMTVEVTRPIGDFTFAPDAQRRGHYCAIAAGSGITPVLSIVASILEGEPISEVTLVYGNRNGGTVMFLEELADLKDRHLDRFTLIHVLSRESNNIPLFDGRLDVAKIDELFDSIIDAKTMDRWFLCGPLGVVEAAQEVLRSRGITEDRIDHELFFSERPPPPPEVVAGDQAGSVVRFTMGGRTSVVRVDPAGAPVLDYVLTVDRKSVV